MTRNLNYEISTQEEINAYNWVTNDIKTLEKAEESEGRPYVVVTNEDTGESHKLPVHEADRGDNGEIAVVTTNANRNWLKKAGRLKEPSAFERVKSFFSLT